MGGLSRCLAANLRCPPRSQGARWVVRSGASAARFSCGAAWWSGCQRPPPLQNSESWPDTLDTLLVGCEAWRRVSGRAGWCMGGPAASISTCSGVVPTDHQPDSGVAAPAGAAHPRCASAPSCCATGGDRAQGLVPPGGTHNGRRLCCSSWWRAPRRHHQHAASCWSHWLAEWGACFWSEPRRPTAGRSMLESPQPASMAPCTAPRAVTHWKHNGEPCRPARIPVFAAQPGGAAEGVEGKPTGSSDPARLWRCRCSTTARVVDPCAVPASRGNAASSSSCGTWEAGETALVR